VSDDDVIGGATTEEVEAHLRQFADKTLKRIAPNAGTIEELRDTLVESLRTDEGMMALIAAVHDDGVLEGRKLAGTAIAAIADTVDPHYQEFETEGDMRVTHEEENLCFRCIHRAVCSVNKATEPEMMVAVRRCLAFVPG
jgi:hypothetical protein